MSSVSSTENGEVKRPLLPSVGSFVLWSAGLLIVSTAVDRIIKGDGASGVVEAVFSFAWLGWIAVLAAIPAWLGFRWLLARFGSRMSGSIPLRGAVVGLSWWLALASMVLAYLLITWPFSPDSEPTIGTVLAGLIAVGAVGAVLGFLEGRAIQRWRVTFGNAD